jgi:hypothetical protein
LVDWVDWLRRIKVKGRRLESLEAGRLEGLSPLAAGYWILDAG